MASNHPIESHLVGEVVGLPPRKSVCRLDPFRYQRRFLHRRSALELTSAGGANVPGRPSAHKMAAGPLRSEGDEGIYT